MNLKPAFKFTTWLIILGLTFGILRSESVSAQALTVSQPDLIITDFWFQNGIINYQIMNIGDAAATSTQATLLTINGKDVISDTISSSINPGQRLDRAFHYPYVCLGLKSDLAVTADTTGVISESNELNNQRDETWLCDANPPLFTSGPTVTNITQTAAAITWVNDEITSGRVEFSSYSGRFDQMVEDTTNSNDHSLKITGLIPDTIYQFRVVVMDTSGNQTISPTGYFTTLPEADSQKPSTFPLSMSNPYPDLVYSRIEAVAADNQGVDRMQLYMDGNLIGTDYSASSEGLFLFDVLPGNLDISREKYFTKHTFTSVAIDRFGNTEQIDHTLTPTFQPMDGYVDLDIPDDDYRFPILGSTVPSGTQQEITATAFQYGLDICASPELFGCHRMTMMVQRVEFYIDHSLVHTALPDPTIPYTFSYTWDISGMPISTHEIQVRAFATDGSMLSETHTYAIEAAASQLNLVRTVYHEGAGFRVTLNLRNQGTRSADILEIKDYLSGFQPVRQEYNDTYHYNLSYDPTSQITNVQFDFEHSWNHAYPLAPGSNLIVEYWVTPVLYPGGVGVQEFSPISGYMIGSEPILVTSQENWVMSQRYFDRRANRTAAYELILDVVENIQQSADYLIVTNPEHLIASTANLSRAENVMAQAADLVLAKGASLGYITGWGSVDDVDAVIEQWGAGMTSASGIAGEWLQDGYLLIVGEDDIIPAGNYTVRSWWYDDKTVHLADAAYANTAGDSIDPELMVGRIIGWADGLYIPLDTLTHLARGEAGYRFDHSDALAVSGFPTTRGGGSDSIDFAGERQSVAAQLENYGSTVAQLNTPDYSTATEAVTAIFAFAPYKDVIHLSGHGSPWSLDDLSNGDLYPTGDLFASANPFVYASSCLTGRYSGEYNGYTIYDGLAETFLYKGAAAYFGSTEKSYFPPSRWMTDLFYNHWTPGRSIGSAIKETKIEAGGSHARAFYEDLWSIEYHIFGDPELGLDEGLSSATSPVQTEIEQTVSSSVEITIPQYTVSMDKQGNADVQIPGGTWVMMEGKPVVPSYPISFEIPQGQRVQNVLMTQRSGLQTSSGLVIPAMQVQTMGSKHAPLNILAQGDEWWTDNDFDWEVQDNTDGTSTLRMVIYPFYYNALTTATEFYTSYTFAIELTQSTVDLLDVQTDRSVYAEGDSVALDLWIENNGPARDVILEAEVTAHGTEEMMGGFPLRQLKDLSGLGTARLEWDSTGIPAGDYTIQVLARDIAGNILDTQTIDIQIGVTTLETDNWMVTPSVFAPGDPVQIRFQVSNTGTLTASGTAVIHVLNDEQGLVAEYSQPVLPLTPGEHQTITQIWDTTSQPNGAYKIVAYVEYASTVAPMMSAEVNTFLQEYLPLILK